MYYPVTMLGSRNPKVSQGYKPGHAGVDIMYKRLPGDGGPAGRASLPTMSPGHYMPGNKPAIAWKEGTVTKSSQIGTGGRIRIDHGGGIWSAYYHLSRRDKKVGDKVKAGQKIGIVGHGKEYPLNHLHFEIWKNGVQVNPAPYLTGTQMVRSPKGAYKWLIYGGAAVVLGLAASRFIK